MLTVASLALLGSSGAQIAAPYFFGRVIKASMQKGMCKLSWVQLYRRWLEVLSSIFCSTELVPHMWNIPCPI